MTSKIFLLRSFFILCSIYALYLIIFISIDNFNLFYKSEGKIYTAENERASKYLFTYRYIPQNFNGLLLGPSLGDQINTKKLKGFKIYNLSVNGANSTELRVLLENVLKQKHHIKVVILTLHRYITKTYGLKTSHLVPQEYFASFTSIEAIKHLGRKIVVSLGLSKDYFNNYGYMNMNLAKKHIDGIKESLKYMETNEKKEFVFNDNALEELKKIIDVLHKNNIQIIGYFHPDPYYFYKDINTESLYWKKSILNMLKNEDIVIDLNSKHYDDFRKDYSNYKDGAHLSNKGEEFVLNKLNEVLKEIE